jgi:hypothetical protein
MVDAMGGTGSSHYARFQSLCYTAFIGLRKNANLILNLFALMVNAGIQDIQLEPDKAVWKVSRPPTAVRCVSALISLGSRKVHVGFEGGGCDQAI